MKANAPNGIAVFDYSMPMDLVLAVRTLLESHIDKGTVTVNPHDVNNVIFYKWEIDINGYTDPKERNSVLHFIGDTFRTAREMI